MFETIGNEIILHIFLHMDFLDPYFLHDIYCIPNILGHLHVHNAEA